jgi:cell shape-determining protein MreD
MKSFYFIFLLALTFDLIIFPTSGSASWLPRLTLVLLPFAFLFTKRRMLEIFFIISGLVFWLTAGINLGLVVFSLGIALFFEKWVVLKIFHKDAWQTLIISSLGVIVFGILLGFTSLILTSEKTFFSGALVLSFVLTTLLSVAVTYILRKIIYKDVYEKTKI